ncbi:MAG TPA: hypothetical protein VM513_26860 [Kofleriaceae bacterium]|nr:hypothetical protein [Kofleriaceae bacterium]
MRSLGIVMCAALLGACGDDGGAMPIDATSFPDEQQPPQGACGVTLGAVPVTLAETGLCEDAGCATTAAEVRLYAPQFELYSDTATKRRWICLPPGATIDTSDMDLWKFPVGTRVWKEFTRDGVRVETRFITKVMDDDAAMGAWLYAAYAWNGTQDAAMLVESTGQLNANGTQHDIPSRGQCKRCHEGLPSRVLGFGAISLDHDAPAGTLDLEDAITAGMLSAPPAGIGAPRFALPGAQLDHDAMGYLHANCGHCHNPGSTTHDVTPLELRLDTTKLATLQATPVYTTAYDVDGMVGAGALLGKIIDPQNTDNSVMLIRFRSTTSPPKMPELGTEMPDSAADTLLSSWIDSL